MGSLTGIKTLYFGEKCQSEILFKLRHMGAVTMIIFKVGGFWKLTVYLGWYLLSFSEINMI